MGAEWTEMTLTCGFCLLSMTNGRSNDIYTERILIRNALPVHHDILCDFLGDTTPRTPSTQQEQQTLI